MCIRDRAPASTGSPSAATPTGHTGWKKGHSSTSRLASTRSTSGVNGQGRVAADGQNLLYLDEARPAVPLGVSRQGAVDQRHTIARRDRRRELVGGRVPRQQREQAVTLGLSDEYRHGEEPVHGSVEYGLAEEQGAPPYL